MPELLTSHSAKIKITKLKNLLWECYSNLQNLYGADKDDFLTGHTERLTFSEAKNLGIKLKKRNKRDFRKK